MFIVFVRFVRRLNELLAQTHSRARPVAEGLAISTPLLLFVLAPLFFSVPGLADVLLITGLVLLLIYFCRVAGTINALYRDTPAI